VTLNSREDRAAPSGRVVDRAEAANGQVTGQLFVSSVLRVPVSGPATWMEPVGMSEVHAQQPSAHPVTRHIADRA